MSRDIAPLSLSSVSDRAASIAELRQLVAKYQEQGIDSAYVRTLKRTIDKLAHLNEVQLHISERSILFEAIREINWIMKETKWMTSEIQSQHGVNGHVNIKSTRTTVEHPRIVKINSWPRFWDILAFALPKKIREQVYEPYQNELLEDYLLAKKFKGKWARRWIALCFSVRTVIAILASFRVAGLNKLLAPFRKLWPRLREFLGTNN